VAGKSIGTFWQTGNLGAFCFNFRRAFIEQSINDEAIGGALIQENSETAPPL
jgi:hypothetical protein